MISIPELCPCCSGKLYKECCLPYHEGRPAENALKLMRSRYSAYVLSLPDYIIETTHSKNPSYEKNKLNWTNSIRAFSQGALFKDLRILDFEEIQDLAYVTFIAVLEQQNKDASFQEKSRFEKENGLWKYRSGVVSYVY